MREIGTVRLLQVQRSALKIGEKPHRRYDPASLVTVESLLLSAEGIVGVMADSSQILDIHHTQHPASRYRDGNSISIGFTSHYRAIQDRYGQHVTLGCAGENIIIEADSPYTAEELGDRLAIRSALTGARVYLVGLMGIPPCVEFSRFVCARPEGLTAEQLRETLEFLSGGRRGFYATLGGGDRQATIRIGDQLVVVD